jgi:hypothetical protein
LACTRRAFVPVAVAWLIHELGGEHLGRTRVNQEVTNDEATLERDSLFSIPMSIVLRRMLTNQDSYEANQMWQAGQKSSQESARVTFCCSSPGNMIATRWQTNLVYWPHTSHHT